MLLEALVDQWHRSTRSHWIPGFCFSTLLYVNSKAHSEDNLVNRGCFSDAAVFRSINVVCGFPELFLMNGLCQPKWWMNKSKSAKVWKTNQVGVRNCAFTSAHVQLQMTFSVSSECSLTAYHLFEFLCNYFIPNDTTNRGLICTYRTLWQRHLSVDI